jgi:hypothetical protein
MNGNQKCGKIVKKIHYFVNIVSKFINGWEIFYIKGKKV